MTTSEIENDQNDLDQNDHVGTTPFIRNVVTTVQYILSFLVYIKI